MFSDITKMLDLRVMDTGSKRHVLDKMAAGVAALGDARLSRLHADALAQTAVASEVNLQWLNQKEINDTARSDARAIDHDLDRQLGSLHTILKTFAELPTGGPAAAHARSVIDALFVRGVAPYTTLSFNQEHDQVRTLIAKLRSDHAAAIAAVNLSDMVDDLEALNTEYGRALNKDVLRISFEKVTQARRQSDTAFHTFLLALIGHMADQPDALSEHLEPLRVQQKRLATYLRRHNASPTVDPETGEPMEPPEPLDEVVAPAEPV
ncbi:DUF6261 family protein [Bradymonas sediminis]|uniref:Uncharacterized protein n=1 Tax=Bradymonas sediminis TaxID=1548548 RepID=A0A2Z4FI55_9DELT|nr:DUF6261 family protein [Bradymonas sediminis]AWV88563.1 hypothetical protein DN745_04115 [Bradymonas sediminis]TDP77704.1 hypothetical protein DFR33_101615 [Bradymonas sediminis]